MQLDKGLKTYELNPNGSLGIRARTSPSGSDQVVPEPAAAGGKHDIGLKLYRQLSVFI